MITIADAISELLFDHDVVVVPGFGAFVVKQTPAKVNVITNHFSSPGAEVVFDAKICEENNSRYGTQSFGNLRIKIR